MRGSHQVLEPISRAIEYTTNEKPKTLLSGFEVSLAKGLWLAILESREVRVGTIVGQKSNAPKCVISITP
jgi:hypothetical protein